MTAEILRQIKQWAIKKLSARAPCIYILSAPPCSRQISDAYLSSENNMNNLFLTTKYKKIKFLSSRHVANQLMFSSISYGKREQYGKAANFFLHYLRTYHVFIHMARIYTVDSPSLETSLTRTLCQLEAKSISLNFRHTFTAILLQVTRTLDNSDLPLTRGNLRFPLGHSPFLPSITPTKSSAGEKLKKQIVCCCPKRLIHFEAAL